MQNETDKSLQDRFAAHNQCFGCGPSNAEGLRIKSFPEGELGLVCRWFPEPRYEAFPNVLNGGICGTLLDCHSNWTAAWHLMRVGGLEGPPCTVTADFHVKLRRPTRTDGPVEVHSRVVEAEGSKVLVEASLTDSTGEVTATCRGHFVAVREGHPAYNRW